MNEVELMQARFRVLQGLLSASVNENIELRAQNIVLHAENAKLKEPPVPLPLPIAEPVAPEVQG